MNTQTKFTIQDGGGRSVTVKESIVIESLVKVILNSKDNLKIQANQLDSVLVKVSKDSSRGHNWTPSLLNLPSVNKNEDYSRPIKSVVRKLDSPLINEVSDEDSLSIDEPNDDKKMSSSAVASSTQSNTRKVYSLVSRMTGKIGGNGNGGAIYGELTIGSMQKIIELMKKHTNFNKSSRFIDIGCGLAKPNLHVAQDPGVQFSYGVEMERVRWLLGMCNLNQVLDESLKQNTNEKIKTKDAIGHKCVIEHGDISDAEYLDPFTHIYMFDIGFPPKLFKKLSIMFNKSKCPYLICYHSPRVMITRFGFEVELIIQTQTTMHGSSEGHMGYIYKRIHRRNTSKIKKKCRIISYNSESIPCDPMFIPALKSSCRHLEIISKDIRKVVINNLSSSRSTRNNIITPNK